MPIEHRTEDEVARSLILALDTDDPRHALETVERFGRRIRTFKVGLQLFTKTGPEIVSHIHGKGHKVFLDLKFHDIPNTVAGAVVEAARMGVFMMNVHALGGLSMMETAAREVVRTCLKENRDRPRLIAVTLLTSIDQEMLANEIGIPARIPTQVRHLAQMTKKAGLDGVVASPQELVLIKEACGPDFLVVTPGIRPPWSPQDDQKRTMTPRQALMDGADFLVIGRAVTAHRNPDEALDRLIEESAF